MKKKPSTAPRNAKIKQVETLLRTHDQMTSREVAAKIGISQPLANIYLNSLEAAGVAKIYGQRRDYDVGRNAFVWGLVNRPWYKRLSSWLSKPVSVEVQASA